MKTVRSPLAAVLVLIVVVVGWVPAQTDVDPFVQAARKRESAVKVVDITFKLKEVRPKGSPVSGAGVVPGIPKDGTLESDLVLESTNRVVIQGTMVRYEGAHPMWYPIHGKALPEDVPSVSGKGAAKLFWAKGHGTSSQPAGIIENSGMNMYTKVHYLVPLIVAYRGTNRLLAPYPITTLKPTGINQSINGRSCQEYARIENDNRMSYYVDPESDYQVVRMVWTRRNRVELQTDITYVKSPVCGWAPASWTEHFYTPSGKLSRHEEGEVVSSKFNESLSEDQFDVIFPPGTNVFDKRDNKDYRVQSDGRLRLRSRSGEELDTVVSQGDSPWYRRYMWWIVAAGGAAIVPWLAWFVRKRRMPSP